MNIINKIKCLLLRKKIVNYLKKRSELSGDPEVQSVIQFLLHNKIEIFPYPFLKKYKNMQIRVYQDSDGYMYVLHNGKKLYGKYSWSEKVFKEYYSFLLSEQNPLSPHCYFTGKDRIPKKGSIVADIGVAEGNFSLDIIESVSKIYMFECDKDWLEPLKRTFQPWLDKVQFVEAFVSDEDTGDNITLDSYFKDKDIDYIKADIEGAEERMLKGGIHTFSSKIKSALLCAYHTNDAESIIIDYATKHGFLCDINHGYMLFYNGSPLNLAKPFIRRGVIWLYK
ncbi:MAG: FkbM family methyltransferase [Lachnospiraceae bacterium]|nr:FkbM family methyltransferase [Lachnospiraceae bacterium]